VRRIASVRIFLSEDVDIYEFYTKLWTAEIDIFSRTASIEIAETFRQLSQEKSY